MSYVDEFQSNRMWSLIFIAACVIAFFVGIAADGMLEGISFVTVIFFYILYRLILRCPSCGKFFE